MSTLQLAAIVWGAEAAAFVLLMIFKSTVTLHEDDSLHLSNAEHQFEEEQAKLQKRIATLERYSRALGISLLVTTLIVGGIWLNGFLNTRGA